MLVPRASGRIPIARSFGETLCFKGPTNHASDSHAHAAGVQVLDLLVGRL